MPCRRPRQKTKTASVRASPGRRLEAMNASPPAWPDQLFDTLNRANIRQVGYVPDAGHSRLIARCTAHPYTRDVALPPVVVGSARAAGAGRGGLRAALL